MTDVKKIIDAIKPLVDDGGVFVGILSLKDGTVLPFKIGADLKPANLVGLFEIAKHGVLNQTTHSSKVE